MRTTQKRTAEEFEAVAKQLNPYYGQKFDDGHVPVGCECAETYCWICNADLYGCSVCGGLEGSLPTHCPGAPMTKDQDDDVYEGRIDYRDGQWINGVTIAMVHSHATAILDGPA